MTHRRDADEVLFETIQRTTDALGIDDLQLSTMPVMLRADMGTTLLRQVATDTKANPNGKPTNATHALLGNLTHAAFNGHPMTAYDGFIKHYLESVLTNNAAHAQDPEWPAFEKKDVMCLHTDLIHYYPATRNKPHMPHLIRHGVDYTRENHYSCDLKEVVNRESPVQLVKHISYSLLARIQQSKPLKALYDQLPGEEVFIPPVVVFTRRKPETLDR